MHVYPQQSEGIVAVILQTKQTLTVQTPADIATSKQLLWNKVTCIMYSTMMCIIAAKYNGPALVQ